MINWLSTIKYLLQKIAAYCPGEVLLNSKRHNNHI